jgi:hypothetical protein
MVGDSLMARYAEVISNIVERIIIAELNELPATTGFWDDVSNKLCNVGWIEAGGTYTAPVPVPTTRFVLDRAEWVYTWTPSELRSLKKAAAGDLSPAPVPDAVSEKIDQLIMAIQLTNSFDVQSDKAYQFYDYLVQEGFITQARADELQAGITE